ncbi:MAG: hypothetical protein A2W93_09475 [Bacteroidetes bacterium GWF2_43_63]|nr:MAG: hypothetical protein A2W94_05860 [Bacteroidetes bacterium GWE2_42_42]OFY54524.1 MAG: hypothetical protein A2W93_09475 [Bacteroidetes bacterium GWF2_43_63]HBG70476.1 hypothetical protein [Bacteroidales bacterium]HCB63406.1 hypothetical protein [Bacteroidales bacterium]
MDWTNIKTKLPSKSGVYLVSASKPLSNGRFVFSYVAYYDKENNRWHKYDPFSDSDIKSETIDTVIGWIETLPTFLG